MEALVEELLQEINDICIGYHYFRQTDVVEKGIGLSEKIGLFISVLLKENVFGVEEAELVEFQNYVLETLKDYAEAVTQRDSVLMVDTLDYGLRELLNIFKESDDGEEANAEKNV